MTIYGCTTSKRRQMKASLFHPELEQDPDTGEFQRIWVSLGWIPCHVTGIAASGKDAPGTFEYFSANGRYMQTDILRMYTDKELPKDFKIAFVLDARGTLLFIEDDGAPTIYDSNGSVPIVDAGGRAREYVTMLTRSEVQDVSALAGS